ncbi:hypothetical protein PIB30_058811 [Stylosanthes scabra]|uniref:F-box protein At3g26010-like beta-propeller domain-containing protein n=1 Tax=Stylosanthes scabra TaxID=79078 RepID=A0ABU6RKN6_9FABA|nr:hypothetical protein [Stylosanthes scabra]
MQKLITEDTRNFYRGNPQKRDKKPTGSNPVKSSTINNNGYTISPPSSTRVSLQSTKYIITTDGININSPQSGHLKSDIREGNNNSKCALWNRLFPLIFSSLRRRSPFTDNSNNRFIHLNVYTNFEGTLNYHLLRSCNGLQLWDSTPTPWPSPPYDAEANKILQRCFFFYVTNPSTGHCVRIDRFGFAFHPGFSSAFLVFEPWISPHYKIIFFEISSKRKTKMSVYSSETGSWSKHDLLSPLPRDLYCFPEPGVYCNGAIHWFELGYNFVNSLYFDIDKLCFKDLPVLPVTHGVLPCDQLQAMHFGESGGNLYLITARSTVKLKYDIWELKEDYSRWILRYNVDATKNNLVRNWCISVAPIRVVRQPPNEDGEEESIFAILIVEHRKLVSYNLKDHSRKILHQEDRFLLPPYFKDQYFETLASV